jgi:N-acetylmuramoyl-L-alanine amidase
MNSMKRQKKAIQTHSPIVRTPLRSWIVVCFLLVLFPTVSSAVTARDKYFHADASYKKLKQNPTKQKFRHNWLTCIRKYQAVYKHDPSGSWAAAGLYKSGLLYQELYRRSGRKSDQREALDIFKRIVNRYPKSRYRKKAEIALRAIPVEKKPKTATKKKAKKKISPVPVKKPDPPKTPDVRMSSSPGTTTVTGLRHWSNPNYTRIVIDADRETRFSHRLLKKDPSIHKPQRLYVDLNDSILGKEAQKIIPINDTHLKDARAGQYAPDRVRVVVDIKSFDTYKIFSLKNPFRIVLDVWGKPQTAKLPTVIPKAGSADAPSGSLAKQLALGVSRIVIDPGHGGKDYGAPGYLKGVHEKHIALKLAKRLARMVRDRLKCEVVLTRSRDRYLTLEERTAIANTQNADLFISIHTNAARDRRAFGIETYILNLATDKRAILVAARENQTSAKNISDLQSILNNLMKNVKVNESGRLANYIQASIYGHMRKRYSRIKNLGVKQAPFYVLLGAQMPSILIETSFISNPRECKRLNSAKYQEQLCEGIVRGIRKYIQETNPLALSKRQ